QNSTTSASALGRNDPKIALYDKASSAMVVKAPPPAPPVFNWTGWYAGVNAGASFGHVKTDFKDPVTVQTTVTGFTRNGIASGSAGFTSSFAGSNEITNPSGFIGGGQIGYNYQLSPIWVVGFEADF